MCQEQRELKFEEKRSYLDNLPILEAIRRKLDTLHSVKTSSPGLFERRRSQFKLPRKNEKVFSGSHGNKILAFLQRGRSERQKAIRARRGLPMVL